MLFQLSGGILWLGIHLGMNGELRLEEPPDYPPTQARSPRPAPGQRHALVFEDKRLFGRVLFHHGAEPPAWWSSLAQGVLSRQFTLAATAHFLQRRRRAPLKAVLLMQERFPGIGNWMADEILWRARLHPATPAGSLDDAQDPRPLGTGPLGQPHRHPHHQRRLDLPAHLALCPPLGSRRSRAPVAAPLSTAPPSAAGPPAGAPFASRNRLPSRVLRLEIPLS